MSDPSRPPLGSLRDNYNHGYLDPFPDWDSRERNAPLDPEQRSSSYAHIQTKDDAIARSTRSRSTLVDSSPTSPTQPFSRHTSHALAPDECIEPKALSGEVADMMNGLRITGSNSFSDAPFLQDSDGGALVAEALTDAHPVPGLPIPRSPDSATATPTESFNTICYDHPTYVEPAYASTARVLGDRACDTHYNSNLHNLPEHDYVSRPWPGALPTSPPQPSLELSMSRSFVATADQTRYTPVGDHYVHSSPSNQIPYSTNAEGHPRRAARSLPSSILEGPSGNLFRGMPDSPRGRNGSFPRSVRSTPTRMTDGSFSSYIAPDFPGQANNGSFSSYIAPDFPGQANNGSFSSYIAPDFPGQANNGSVRDDDRRLEASGLEPNGSLAVDGAMGVIDTQTPVIVIDPDPQPSFHSSRSDGASTSRDNVLPGEELLFDGRVKMAQSLSSHLMDGFLKVFRNTLSTDLRFHCKVGHDSETYWMRGSRAQIVPVYAYDQRFHNILYVRDNDSDSHNRRAQERGRPYEVFQFGRFQELCDFQAKLTGEKVVLDISSAKLVKLSKAHSRSSETHSGIRVQIWHEEAQRSTPSDVASIVTAGTTLSGPHRDRTTPNSSRLIVYLGRLDEYITVFNDIRFVIEEGKTSIKLKPTKSGNVLRGPGGVRACREARKGSEPAGLDAHGQGTNPDTIESFETYKTFEIHFETESSQSNFISKWQEVMNARRLQRKELQRIQEEMNNLIFSGHTARGIW